MPPVVVLLVLEPNVPDSDFSWPWILDWRSDTVRLRTILRASAISTVTGISLHMLLKLRGSCVVALVSAAMCEATFYCALRRVSGTCSSLEVNSSCRHCARHS